MFKREDGNWTRFWNLPEVKEVDLHWQGRGHGGSYVEKMSKVRECAFQSLVEAQRDGNLYVLFTHGHSTSRLGATTARSVVRGLMRSKFATPYIVRSECIQHDSVFVAAIRPLSPVKT